MRRTKEFSNPDLVTPDSQGFKNFLNDSDCFVYEDEADVVSSTAYHYTEECHSVEAISFHFTNYSSITIKATIDESGRPVLMFKEDDGKYKRDKELAQCLVRRLHKNLHTTEEKFMAEKFSSNPRKGSIDQLAKNVQEARNAYEKANVDYFAKYEDKNNA